MPCCTTRFLDWRDARLDVQCQVLEGQAVLAHLLISVMVVNSAVAVMMKWLAVEMVKKGLKIG